MATMTEAAAHIHMSRARFTELVDRGMFGPTPEKGAWDLDLIRRTYIAHVRARAAGHTSSGELDPQQERARKDKELADHTALKNAMLRKELLPAEQVNTAVVAMVTQTKTRIMALPNTLAPIVAQAGGSISEIRRIITAGLTDALSGLHDTRVLERVIAADQSGDGEGSDDLDAGVEAAPDEDGERVVRSRAQAEPGGVRRSRAVGH